MYGKVGMYMFETALVLISCFFSFDGCPFTYLHWVLFSEVILGLCTRLDMFARPGEQPVYGCHMKISIFGSYDVCWSL